MDQEILARVEASAVRRWSGVGMLSVIGCLVIYVAFAAPPAFFWQMFLLALGALALWMAEKMRRATEHVIELTETELRDTAGNRIALVEDIEAIDRGTFAFKPSNGFLLKTRVPAARRWLPGLWWRMGRRIGVGGVAPGAQTKFMSEILSAMLAQRS